MCSIFDILVHIIPPHSFSLYIGLGGQISKNMHHLIFISAVIVQVLKGISVLQKVHLEGLKVDFLKCELFIYDFIISYFHKPLAKPPLPLTDGIVCMYPADFTHQPPYTLQVYIICHQLSDYSYYIISFWNSLPKALGCVSSVNNSWKHVWFLITVILTYFLLNVNFLF